MRSKILLFLFLLFALISKAQDSSFHLKDYKYRTPGFRALSIGIDFSATASDSRFEDSAKSSAKNFYLLPSKISYDRIISTEKRVHRSFIDLNTYGRTFTTRKDASTSKSQSAAYNFVWGRNDRFYKTNHWFFEIGNQLRNSLGTNHYEDTVYNSNTTNLEVEDKIVFGFGKGRIEMVQDAQMALYILNDLQKEGLLNGPVSAEVAHNLAQLITEIKNLRIFDDRKKRIYELTRIENFLRSSGLVEKTDIRHFAIINDNWALAYNPVRLSGSNWYVQLQPSAGIKKNKDNYTYLAGKTTGSNTNKFFKISPVIGFEKYIPVNLKWQRNLMLIVSWFTGWENYHSRANANGTEWGNDEFFSESATSLYASYGLGYYPNNRTAVNANLGMQVMQNKYDDKLYVKKSILLRPTLHLSADYFIGYKTRLNTFWNLSYEKSFRHLVSGGIRKSNDFGTAVSIGLVHTIL